VATEAVVRQKFSILQPHLNERSRRIWAASEAKALGYGGVSLVARATGISRRAILVGIRESVIDSGASPSRIRRTGGGRKSAVVHQPDLATKLESLVEPLSRGDPESPLRWTCKSTRVLAQELSNCGYKVSSRIVRHLLHKMDYSLQGNSKTLEGKQHPDRNAQFEFINACVSAQMRASQPVISVDTKKKELIGNFANKGTQWLGKGEARKVNDHDFPDPSIPRAHPYGIYDLSLNVGFVNIGTDHDTATFAVASIRKWWRSIGRHSYPNAKRMLITADAGGSNGSRLRLWKWELQIFANETGLPVSVCHFPPGTSKWNKVEHRLFSFISMNWRGEPLTDYETVVNLISRTVTATGLKVTCKLDRRNYPVGKEVLPGDWEKINIVPNEFHGDWNYTIRPE
jgi:hypothetical protein